MKGEHINAEGRFQSDKYPTCPPGKVPLSTSDATAQDLLWEYAQRRRIVDKGFSADLEACLRADGFVPGTADRHVKLIAWFGNLLRRFDKLDDELAPLRRKAQRGDDMTAAERKKLLRLLDNHEGLLAEQSSRLGDRFLSAIATTQKALLKRLVKMSKVGPQKPRRKKVPRAR